MKGNRRAVADIVGRLFDVDEDWRPPETRVCNRAAQQLMTAFCHPKRH
jgi:hypothetical protein